jgi:hypothetical protein
MDSSRQICCDCNVVISINKHNTACCQGDCYNPGLQLCCDGAIVSKKFGGDSYCCGNDVFSPSFGICCGNHVLWKWNKWNSFVNKPCK